MSRVTLGALVGVLLIGGIGAGGYLLYNESVVGGKVRTAARREAPEVEECKARLKKIHAAWSKYRADHRGADPPEPTSLLNGYLKPEDLLCPAAKRVFDAGQAVDTGRIQWKGKDYNVTYGLRWLTSGFIMSRRRNGDRAVLVNCSVHRELALRHIYGRFPDETLPDGELRRLSAAGLTGRNLAVLVNGEVTEADADD